MTGNYQKAFKNSSSIEKGKPESEIWYDSPEIQLQNQNKDSDEIENIVLM